MIEVMVMEGLIIAEKNLIIEEIKTNQLNPNQLVAIKVESLHKPVILMSRSEALKQTSSEYSFEEIKGLSNNYKHNPKWIDGDFTLTSTHWKTSPVSKNFS